MVFDAIEFAAKAHYGHYRKSGQVPYILHPLGVARILIESECPEAVVVAGILHDTVEDTPVTLDEIQQRFGERVAWLVEQVSEPDKSDTWENRKQHTIELLRKAPVEVLWLACADKLDNIVSMKADQVRLGDSFWSRFNRPKEAQRWYYESLVQVFLSRLTEEPGVSMAQRLAQEVQAVFSEWFPNVG